MFRHSLLPHAWPAGGCLAGRFALGLGFVLLVAPVPASSQDRSTQERLDRIERDLNMLQRQVYRGGPPPTGGDPGNAVGTELRLTRIEEQMRDLNGRVEEVMNQVDRLRQRLEQVNSDVDTRIGQGPGGPPGSGQMALAGPPPRSGPRPLSDNTGTPPRGTVVPPPSFGTLTPPGAPPGVASGVPPGFPTPPPGAEPASGAGGGMRAGPGQNLPSGSTTEQYNYAFGLLKQADYQGSEAALRAFIERHPSDPMAGNAQYWLGETYYARSKFMEAASTFAEGYKRYPKSAKAPDTLLKLGMSLAQANQKQNACVALAQLDQAFPQAASNIKQQAATERKRLGC
jgi:tol-pal system protein YbgF